MNPMFFAIIAAVILMKDNECDDESDEYDYEPESGKWTIVQIIAGIICGLLPIVLVGLLLK